MNQNKNKNNNQIIVLESNTNIVKCYCGKRNCIDYKKHKQEVLEFTKNNTLDSLFPEQFIDFHIIQYEKKYLFGLLTLTHYKVMLYYPTYSRIVNKKEFVELWKRNRL